MWNPTISHGVFSSYYKTMFKQRSREADSRHWFRRSEDSPAENRKPNLQQTMAHGVWKTVKRRGTTYSLLHKVSEISY